MSTLYSRQFSWKGRANTSHPIVSNKEGSTKGDITPGVVVGDKELVWEEVKMKDKLVGEHKRLCCLHGRIWKMVNALVMRGG